MAHWICASSLLLSLVALSALAVQFWLYSKLRREFQKAVSYMATHDDVTSGVGSLSEQLSGFEIRMDRIENSKREQEEWIGEAESVNLNRRGQVLRMHRRGEAVPDIASALRVGQGEVRLIIKVFELSKGDGASDENGFAALP